MKRVLLTGASGFIGRHAIPFLIEKGYEVHAVYNERNKGLNEENNLYWHKCNLLNPIEQSQLLTEIMPTHLLHFAWYAIHNKYWTALENYTWTKASLDLFNNFIDNGGRRAVFAGTCAEYDVSHGYCVESITPTQPSTLYGICKHNLQVVTERISNETGFSSAWGRIFYLYGPYEQQTRLVPYVVCSLLKEEVAHCSHGRQIRDFLYVEDVANAFVTLLETDVRGPVNIASGKPVAIKDVIFKIAEKLNCDRSVEFGVIPVHQEPSNLTADVTRLHKEVGWYPKYSLDQGLEETIRWWQKYLRDGNG